MSNRSFQTTQEFQSYLLERLDTIADDTASTKTDLRLLRGDFSELKANGCARGMLRGQQIEQLEHSDKRQWKAIDAAQRPGRKASGVAVITGIVVGILNWLAARFGLGGGQ